MSNMKTPEEPGTPSGDMTVPRRLDRLIIEGSDNYGKPKQEFADRLAAASDEGYLKLAEQCIWLSAYANNNPRSDYHWMADACHDEAKRRGNPDLYQRAWNKAAGQ